MESRCSMPATRMRGTPRAPASCAWGDPWPMASEAATWLCGTEQRFFCCLGPFPHFRLADWAAELALLGRHYQLCCSCHLA